MPTAGNTSKGSTAFSLLAGAVTAGIPLALLAKHANDQHKDNCDKADFILRTRDHELTGSQRLPDFLHGDVISMCADRMASQPWARWIFGDTASASTATESDLTTYVRQLLTETEAVWCSLGGKSNSNDSVLPRFDCVVTSVSLEEIGASLSMESIYSMWDALSFTVQHGVSARTRLQSLDACVTASRREIAKVNGRSVARVVLARDSAGVEACCRDLKTSSGSESVLVEAWHPADVAVLTARGFERVEERSYFGNTYSAMVVPQAAAAPASGVMLSVVWFKLPSA